MLLDDTLPFELIGEAAFRFSLCFIRNIFETPFDLDFVINSEVIFLVYYGNKYLLKIKVLSAISVQMIRHVYF